MVLREIPNNRATSLPHGKLLLATILSLLVLVLSTSSIWQAYAPVSPFIINEFGLSKTQFGLMGMVASIGGLFSSIIFGLIIDRISIKKGIILVPGLMSLICSAIYFTKTFQGLMVMLFLQGMVFIAMTPLTNKIVFRIIPPGYRVTAIGIKQSMIPAGSATTAMFLPLVAMHGNWRYVYILLGLFLAMMTIFSYLVYQEKDSLNISQSMKKVSHLEKRGKLFTPAFLATMFLGLSFTVSQSSLINFLTPFSHEYLGMPVLKASSVLAATQFSGVFSRIVLGFFSDKFFTGHHKWELAVLMFSNSLLFFVMGRVSPEINIFAFYALCLLLGISAMAWYGSYSAMVIGQLGEDRAGFASGIASTFTMVGTSFGPFIFGFLTDAFRAYSPSFMVISLWMLLAGLIFSLVPRKEGYSVV